MKPKRYGNTLPLRIAPQSAARIKKLSDNTKLSASDIARMAINHGLPLLERGELPGVKSVA